MVETPTVHPREAYALEHSEAAEQAFASAQARGRLHHGWLLTGPEGVGKATFAYRAARRLLGAAADRHYGVLGAHPDDRVSRLIAARAHPDLMALDRIGEDGKLRRTIPVDEARRLPEFFSKAPAMGGWRVAIVDSVDDMNVSAANALLKILEEPPERGVLLLVSHAPGGLLDTIRSRCRRLRFAPWPEDGVAAFVAARTDMNAEQALRLARMAAGSPGRALALARSGALDADDTAREIIARLPETDVTALQHAVEGFRGAEGGERFRLLIERLGDHVRRRATGGGGAPWASAWSRLTDLPGEVEGLNLDRGDAFWTAIEYLRATARG